MVQSAEESEIKFMLFLEPNCVREDLIRVLQTLSKNLELLGHKVTSLAGTGVREVELEKNGLPDLILWDELIKNNSRAMFNLSELGFFFLFFTKALPLVVNPITALRVAIESCAFRRFLKSQKIHKILGIKYSVFFSLGLVLAADSLGIPTFAIQHGVYESRSLVKTPHEFPASHIFLWSAEEVKRHADRFSHLGRTFILAGPIWSLRHASGSTVKSSRFVSIVESDTNILTDQFMLRAIESVGEESLKIKPHPDPSVEIRPGGKSFPLLHDRTPFWLAKPSIAISLGSSSTWELIYLGVPVITILETGYELDFWPKSATFMASEEGIESAFMLLRELRSNPEKREALLREQQRELSSVYPEADKALLNIIEGLTA
jgi:hypothetical protein